MNLKDNLKNQLTTQELKELKTSFDIIGDIAILEICEKLQPKEQLIGKAILKVNNNIKTVLKKSGIHQGEFRTQKLSYIHGENKKETIYKENNVNLKLNPETVYFSPRLSTERKELLKELPSKKILIMFSGCGPYSFVAYRLNPNHKRITSIEINPQGHKFALENLQLNKSIGKKNKYFKLLKTFLQKEFQFSNEKYILNIINNLILQFFNADVKKQILNFKLTKANPNTQTFDDIKNINYKETYNLKNKTIQIKNLNQDNLIKFLLLSQNNTFIHENYIFKTQLEKNYLLNLFEGDNLQNITKYDEIFMPLPKDAEMFLEEAFHCANKNCKIHMYDFIEEKNFPKLTENKILKISEKLNKKVKITNTRKVGQYSPRKYRTCCDFIITQ